MWLSTQWAFATSRHAAGTCCPSGTFLQSCFPASWPQPLLLQWVVLLQEHYLAHGFVELWEVQHFASSSTSCPWILFWLELLQNQNQLFIAIKNVYLLACYRVLKAFGRNRLWTWYTNLVKLGFLIPASPEKQLMNGFASQQGFPGRR